ncbi:MAG: DUF2232 domain-containing protein [Candidatus Hydrogenedentes bacterium]|nr:DUF2232 domain-containing protein [Candidatus Hydrogenedentota bacterium]
MAAGKLAAVFRHASAFTAAVLFCGVLSWVGAIPVALLPFVFLVAVYCATGRTWLGGLATASVVLIVGFVTLGTETAFFCGLFVLSGVALGSGIRREAAFGTVVTVVTVWLCGVFAGYLAFHMTWSGWERQAAGWYEAVLAETREVAGNAKEQEAAYDFLQWIFVEHWADVSMGLIFASFLMCAVLATGAAATWVRSRHGLAGLRTTFAKMRPPEWLVWPAIGCAVLWFVEQRIPNDALRAISWNAAIGIAAVYWLNGLSILVYALRHLRLHVFVVIALLVFMMYAGAWILSFVGLFDTWWEFRAKVDHLVAVRDKLREGDGNGDGNNE